MSILYGAVRLQLRRDRITIDMVSTAIRREIISHPQSAQDMVNETADEAVRPWHRSADLLQDSANP